MAPVGLFLDDEINRLKQGRYSGEEEELRRELSMRDFSLRLPSLRAVAGPSIQSWLGVPALRSSRASKGGARPFHLHHSTISKGDSARSVARKDRIYFAISRGQVPAAREAAGPSLKWQRSAKCWYAPSGSAASLRLAARYAVAPPPSRAPSPSAKPPGTAAAHQRYIERESAEARDEEGAAVYSLGTIGEDTAERAAFWNAVEGRERADGLVQCRVVAELPHELGPESQRAAVEEFMETFAERGLPAHGVVHRPDAVRGLTANEAISRPEAERRRGGGDPRNVHVHFVYHDRPCERRGPGEWDFAPRKDREARGPAWIRALRERWADACNGALEREERETRFHPGSYEDLGIEKLPQQHLGPVLSAFERQGRATDRGTVNLICERDWEHRQALGEALNLAETSTAWLRRVTELEAAQGEGEAAARRLFEGRVGELDRRSAGFDAEAVVAARDREGRRERAESLWAHAVRRTARGGEHVETWQRIAAAAADSVLEQGGRRAGAHFLSEHAAGQAAADEDDDGYWRRVADLTSAAAQEERLAHPAPEARPPSARRSARRLDAACRAGERRLEAARLLDRRERLAEEIRSAPPATTDAAAPPLPIFDVPATRHLDRLVAARAGQRRARETADEIAAKGTAASPRDLEVKAVIEREQEELRAREARHRADLEELLAPSLGAGAPEAVEALVAAREKEHAERTAGTPAASGPSGTAPALPAPPEAPRQRERKRRRELRGHLSALFGEAAARRTIDAMVSGAEEGREAVAVASGADGSLTLFPPRPAGPEGPIVTGAQRCLRSLLAARNGQRRAGEAADEIAAKGAAASPRDLEVKAVIQREQEELRRREAQRRDELVRHLAPVFGRDAEETAAALIESAARRASAFVLRRPEGGVSTRPAAGGAAFDAPAAADCFRLLLGARQAVREEEKEEARPRGRASGRALRQELRELDQRIAASPVALRLARRAGLEAEVSENVRRARRPRRARGRDEGR